MTFEPENKYSLMFLGGLKLKNHFFVLEATSSSTAHG